MPAATYTAKLHGSRAFLIRLWCDGPDEPWRASAKQVTDGRELHFASLEKLFLFLHEQTVISPPFTAEADT